MLSYCRKGQKEAGRVALAVTTQVDRLKTEDFSRNEKVLNGGISALQDSL